MVSLDIYNTIPTRYRDASFNGFQVLSKGHEEALYLFQRIAEGAEVGNIMLLGDVGIGKTYLCYALINEMSEKMDNDDFVVSQEVMYSTVKGMIDGVRSTWRKGADRYDFDFIMKLKKAPRLLVDEIGVQYGTDSERIELYDIFNCRYEWELPCTCVSNHNLEQIQDIVGRRTFDRIKGNAKIIEFKGSSMR